MTNIKKVALIGLVTLILTFITLTWLYFIYGKPWDRALFIEPIHKLPTPDKVIALTFDDGPSPTRTPALLDLLDKHHIKATFFMVGANIEKYPDIATEVVKRGHMVGNHSYSHKLMILKTPWFIHTELTKTNTLLQNIGSTDYAYFRPPNTKKLILLPLMLKLLDMKLVTGSYDPDLQYHNPLPGDQVAQQVIDHAQPGAIVYLHDGRDDSVDEFITAVDTIITTLSTQGYTFATIKEYY